MRRPARPARPAHRHRPPRGGHVGLALAGPDAASQGHHLGRTHDQQSRCRLVGPATLDHPERAAGQRRRPRPGRTPVEAPAPASARSRAGAGRRRPGRAGARPGPRWRASPIGHGQERGQRRQPDEFRFRQVDPVLGGDVADGLPDQPERRDLEVEEVHRHLRAPNSSIQKPLACSRGSPPPDSRTRRAIRFASSTSFDARLML